MNKASDPVGGSGPEPDPVPDPVGGIGPDPDPVGGIVPPPMDTQAHLVPMPPIPPPMPDPGPDPPPFPGPELGPPPVPVGSVVFASHFCIATFPFFTIRLMT